jgi:hypothetical protein
MWRCTHLSGGLWLSFTSLGHVQLVSQCHRKIQAAQERDGLIRYFVYPLHVTDASVIDLQPSDRTSPSPRTASSPSCSRSDPEPWPGCSFLQLWRLLNSQNLKYHASRSLCSPGATQDQEWTGVDVIQRADFSMAMPFRQDGRMRWPCAGEGVGTQVGRLAALKLRKKYRDRGDCPLMRGRR